MLRPSDVKICHARGGRGGCLQPIRWTITKAGKAFAVDAEPDPGGNVAIMRDAGGTLRSRQVSAELPLLPYERLMMPHVATCKPVATSPPPPPPRPAQPRAGVLYDVLGVTCEATGADIKTAYRKLACLLHPDVNPEPAAHDRFKQITAAYTVLSNPLARQLYDLTGRPPRVGTP